SRDPACPIEQVAARWSSKRQKSACRKVAYEVSFSCPKMHTPRSLPARNSSADCEYFLRSGLARTRAPIKLRVAHIHTGEARYEGYLTDGLLLTNVRPYWLKIRAVGN